MELLHLPIAQIYIEPDRQRKELGDITDLAASIRENGLLQPIVVMPDENFSEDAPRYKLVAGERRYRAHQHLQYSLIHAVLFAELSADDQELIELDENLKRKQLTWPEHIGAVGRYFHVATKDAKWTQADVAYKLNMPEATLSKMLQLALVLPTAPHLKNASSWTSAYQTVVDKERKEADALVESIMSDGDEISVDDLVPIPPAAAPASPVGRPERSGGLPAGGAESSGVPVSGLPDEPAADPVLPPPASGALTGFAFAYKSDFREWVAGYTGKRFNLIHCDFPYGLNMDTANLQGSSVRWDETDNKYNDSPELFESLLRTFVKERDRFIADSAHIVFWTAHKHVQWVTQMFRAADFWVCDVPLIWHKSGGEGIAPDVRRQPRRTYEIAVFASRGDRTIKKVKAASISAAITKEHHLSEKPMEVVTHFMEMLVDETTEILDPTCGSGTALEAAIRLGAKRATGLDVIAQHVAHTNRRCIAAAAARRTPEPSGGDLVESVLADLE